MIKPDKSKFKIQLLDDDSLDQILAIEQQVHLNPWSAKNIHSCFKNELVQVLGCYCDKKIIGYGVIQIIDTEAELQNFAIAKSFQRLGIGNFFLSGLIRHCQQLAIQKIMLEVRETNVVALQLYFANGFKQMGSRKDYYETSIEKESALLLTRFL